MNETHSFCSYVASKESKRKTLLLCAAASRSTFPKPRPASSSQARDAHRLFDQIEVVSIVEPGERQGVDQLLPGHPTEDDIEPLCGSGVDDAQEGFVELEPLKLEQLPAERIMLQ